MSTSEVKMITTLQNEVKNLSEKNNQLKLSSYYDEYLSFKEAAEKKQQKELSTISKTNIL